MANIASVLREEICRLAKKEINSATKLLRKDNARLKRDVAALKRQVRELERKAKRLVTGVVHLRKKAIDPHTKEVKQARFGPKLIAALRRRLKLNREAFAGLVGVSPNTISSWEKGATAPRTETKAALVDLRRIGVREARRRVEELQ